MVGLVQIIFLIMVSLGCNNPFFNPFRLRVVLWHYLRSIDLFLSSQEEWLFKSYLSGNELVITPYRRTMSTFGYIQHQRKREIQLIRITVKGQGWLIMDKNDVHSAIKLVIAKDRRRRWSSSIG